ncbi:MAG: protein kinase [Actinomycetia bacterium]|nr:protein kinase [Actinomycetes bacterium]
MDGVGDYEFIHLLGEGSHGSFWLARCPQRLNLGLDYVAVKTLSHHGGDADFEMLSEELLRYSAVASPRLVQLYDVGLQGDLLYYSGEYFPDGSLAQPARPFTRASVLLAIADAAFAAHALHDAGIAHRSIRPGNIMIDGTMAKLGDIALSAVLKPGQTVTGLDQVGAIEYLAPELIQGEAASRASDIWALGATMHRVLTGRPIYPYVPDGSSLEALRYILSQQPTLNELLREEEHLVVGKTLSADPADRPLTAMDFAEMVSDVAHRYAAAEPS